MSNSRTPWIHAASTLPSDRITSSKSSTSRPATPAAKGKQKETQVAVPKSKAVRRLESLRNGLSKLGGDAPSIDPAGGCFCQAREHELSKYNPICMSCGLIFCELNLPYYACPHCRAALLTPPARLSLLQTLEQSISDTLAREERECEKIAEEARRAAGAFPTLAAATSGVTGALDSHPVNQPHKVLSLGSKGKNVKVTTYMKRAPNPAVKAVPQGPKDPEPTRVPRPPAEVPFSSKPPNFDRPWYNTRPGSKPVHYISPPSQQRSQHGEGSRRKKAKEGGDNA